MTASEYVAKRKHGRIGNANVDDSDSPDEFDPDLVNKTPNTVRRVKEDKIKSEIKKLGPVGTFLTLIKGFVCMGVLYLPKAFINGGWVMTTLMLVLEAIVTCYCAILLIEVRATTNLTNYSQIG